MWLWMFLLFPPPLALDKEDTQPKIRWTVLGKPCPLNSITASRPVELRLSDAKILQVTKLFRVLNECPSAQGIKASRPRCSAGNGRPDHGFLCGYGSAPTLLHLQPSIRAASDRSRSSSCSIYQSLSRGLYHSSNLGLHSDCDVLP